MKNNKGYRHIT